MKLEQELRQQFAIEQVRVIKSVQKLTLLQFFETCINKGVQVDGLLPGVNHNEMHRCEP